MDERSRTEREDDGTTLIIIRIPYFQGPKVDVPYITVPLGIILNENYIITVGRRPNQIIEEMAKWSCAWLIDSQTLPVCAAHPVEHSFSLLALPA
jgi:Mg2+ and Co2+ transporter CorA